MLLLAFVPFGVAPDVLFAAPRGKVPNSLLKLSSGFVVFVDKRQQQVYVFQSVHGKLEKVFEAPCSTGKVPGPKMVEGDAKTPIGIFFATRFARMPDTSTTYGAMVYYLDYPNLFDKRAKRNGDNIWIHGTNKPLQPNQSNGCVALRNQDLENLSRYIFLGKTPIIIEESISWVNQKDLQPYSDELERLARTWTKSIVDGDERTHQRLYLQEGFEPSTERKGLLKKAAQLRTAKWHFDVMPRDMTICRIDNTAVIMFDQVLSLKSFDDVHSSYVRLYLERYTTGWFIVEGFKPAPVHPKRETVVTALQAGNGRKAETVATGSEGKKAEREVAQLIERWGNSWEKGRMDRYGACYASNFRAQGKNLKAWVAYKQDLSKRYKNIRVRTENLRVAVQGDRATATFKQYYSASNIKSSGLKKLDLIRINGEWKITRETISR
jgi:murein L,D-transpeptidase YafK